MSDTPPTERKIWQVHLSTAVLLMITAAVLVRLNIQPSFPQGFVTFGWPAVAVAEEAQQRIQPTDSFLTHRHLQISGLFIDATAFLSCIVIVSVCSEYLIRRRSKP